MKLTAAQAVVRALEAEEIRHAFGIPGTHNIELYDALASSDRVRPVLVTDEQSASFMADGYWRASGRLACVNLVPGAGLTHALSGIAEAYLDNVPLLVLACGIRLQSDRAYQLHDVDQMAIASPVVKAALRAVRREEVYRTVRGACALARRGVPGPVLVEIPADHYLARDAVEQQPAEAVRADPPELERELLLRALEILESADRTLLYLGFGAAGAADRLVALAERLESPVATTIQGKGVFPESHPLFLWPGFGQAAPPFARRVAEDCNATLAIGSRFSEVGTGSYGLRPPGPLVHVDIDPDVPGRNYDAAVAIAGDARVVVEALLEELGRRPASAALRERIARGHSEVRQPRGGASDGVSPAGLLSALQESYPAETIYAADSGNGTFLAMEGLRLDAPGRFLAPVDYSCMGYAVPAAIGASLARPGCPVVALPGDGAFLMTGLELLTAVREGTSTAVFVLRDRELAQISQFQDIALSRRTSSELPPYDLAALAGAVGVAFRRLSCDAEVEEVVRWSVSRVAEGCPALIEVDVDYSEKTFFTRGVVRAVFGRLSWSDRLRFLGRALGRRVGGVSEPRQEAAGPETKPGG
jgi:acetolactate synthase-1/2/3 large subunit